MTVSLVDDRLLRLRANIPLLVSENLAYSSQVITREFVTFLSVPYIAHVETEVLYDEIGHIAPYFTTNKSNKVKGTVTNSETSRYFDRLTKYGRFNYLLIELNPASLTVCDKWFHKL